MESTNSITSGGISSNLGFFKHVFNFDNDSKADILNIIQYAMIAIIPMVILNKTMQNYVPEADDQKGSIELLAEIIIQTISMFIGILLIHRMITYIPTYSGEKYPEFNVVYIILAALMITLSLQTKLGEKVSILWDRILEMWNGEREDDGDKKKGKNKKGKGNVRVRQPITQEGMANLGQSAINMSLGGGGMGGTTDISSLQPRQHQQQPDYNAMYGGNATPLVNAQTPGQDMMGGGEIMAANELCGSAFGTMF
jgi:hypothetical protein